MSASDATFYNLKRLNLVFALSSAAMVAATLWLVIVDHRREWKAYQRTFRQQIEPWTMHSAAAVGGTCRGGCPQGGLVGRTA